jgi:hypothetical protein
MLAPPRATSFDERRLALSWRMLKRSFKGTCALCGASVDKRRSAVHCGTCAGAHDVDATRSAHLVTLRIAAVGASEYWLDAEADAGAALSKLDAFLRDIWVDCCGHLSMFSVPPFRYTSSPSGLSGLRGRSNTERSMRTKVGEVFGRTGEKGTYDYDFGSTTRLAIERSGTREGRIGKQAVRLLVQNDPLPWTCSVCSQPATLVCCAHEAESSPFVCAAHENAHPCPDAMFLPVVNSPRMGVCGYTG